MLFKICGMREQKDLDVAARLGFAMAGFIFCEQSRRSVSAHAVRRLNSHSLLRTGVFTDCAADKIMATVSEAELDLVQLHGNQDAFVMQELAGTLGVQRLIRVLWPARYANCMELQEDMDRLAPFCAAFLLDAGISGGGHGTQLALDFLQDVTLPRPWMLAGGLDAAALTAIAALPGQYRPCALDFNSRLECAPGRKDADLMAGVVTTSTELGLGPDALPADIGRGRECSFPGEKTQ